MSAPRILIVRLSAHGDVVQTLPLLATIRRRAPQAFVGWLVERAASPLLAHHPMLDRLHICERKRWLTEAKDWRQLPRVWREVQDFLNEIRAQGYTHALDTQGLLKSAIWPWLARVPNRIGDAGAREQAARFYTHTVPAHNRRDINTPAWIEFLRLTDPPGISYLPPAPAGAEAPPILFPLAAVSREAKRPIDVLMAPIHRRFGEATHIIGLAPATTWSSKQWPLPYWRELLGRLSALNLPVVLLGSPEDVPMARTLLGNASGWSHVFNWTGATSLENLPYALGKLAVLVAPDSLALHMGAAVAAQPGQANKPRILGLYGPTSAGRTGPWGLQHETLSTALACQPCFARQCPLPPPQTLACQRLLSVDQVFTAVAGMVSYTAGQPVNSKAAGALPTG